MASYSITTTTTSYTAEEKRLARQQVGPSGSAEAFGKKLQENRAASQASATQQSSQQTTTQSSKEATKADLQNKAKASQGTKKAFYENLLASLEGTAESANDTLDKMDRWMINQVSSLKKTSSYISEGINSATEGAVGSISGLTEGVLGFQEEALHDIQGWSASMKKALEPVGIGSAIGDLTDLAKNPLGAPQFLANSMVSIVNKISPGFVSEMDAAFKTIKLDGLAHLPSKMMGSIRSLATAADAILSVPFEIMSDVYNGLMEILDAIADLIDAVVTTVMNLAMAVVKALIDAIIPVDELLEFFSAIGDLASFVGGIAGMVGGFNMVTDIAGQVSGFASSASSLISNPLASIPGVSQGIGQVTGAVGQVTSALRNPEQFLPPEIGQQMQKISSIPGLGFVGNLGYSVGDTLDSLSDGVFTAALDKFADKAPMLGQFFGKETEPASVDTQEDYPDSFEPPKSGPHETAGGIPQVAETTKILPPELQKAIDDRSTLNQIAPTPEKPWLNKTPINSGTGPTIENAKNLKPQQTGISITAPRVETFPGGSVTIPADFSFPNQPLRL